MVGKPPVLCPGCGGRVLWHIHGPAWRPTGGGTETTRLPLVSVAGKDRDDESYNPRSNGRSFGVLSQGGKLRRWHCAGHTTVQHSCGARRHHHGLHSLEYERGNNQPHPSFDLHHLERLLSCFAPSSSAWLSHDGGCSPGCQCQSARALSHRAEAP